MQFRANLLSSVFWIVLEPLLYLGAIGFGVGHFIPSIEGMSYPQFFAPALMATSGMFLSFLEGTYGSYSRYKEHGTFQQILLSPVSPSDIVLGETLWAASKGFMSAAAISIVALGLGLIPLKFWLLALIVQALICWLFAALGLVISSFARSYDTFTYAQTALIVPMALFSGTYFPLNIFPKWIEHASYIFPLTHGVSATRIVFSGEAHSMIFFNLAMLFLEAVLLTNFATSRISRKLLN